MVDLCPLAIMAKNLQIEAYQYQSILYKRKNYCNIVIIQMSDAAMNFVMKSCRLAKKNLTVKQNDRKLSVVCSGNSNSHTP